jgi:hypothetical protein
MGRIGEPRRFSDPASQCSCCTQSRRRRSAPSIPPTPSATPTAHAASESVVGVESRRSRAGRGRRARADTAHVLDDPRVVSLWDGSRLAGRWFADHSTGASAHPATSSGTPTSPSARAPGGGASQAACSPPAATSSTTPADSSSTSSRFSRAAEAGAHATIDGYDRSDGQAALSAAQPFQGADRPPTPPVRANRAERLARRATRRSGHRCA